MQTNKDWSSLLRQQPPSQFVITCLKCRENSLWSCQSRKHSCILSKPLRSNLIPEETFPLALQISLDIQGGKKKLTTSFRRETHEGAIMPTIYKQSQKCDSMKHKPNLLPSIEEMHSQVGFQFSKHISRK